MIYWIYDGVFAASLGDPDTSFAMQAGGSPTDITAGTGARHAAYNGAHHEMRGRQRPEDPCKDRDAVRPDRDLSTLITLIPA